MVPLPRVPLMQGSSHKCGAALATTGLVPKRQKPFPAFLFLAAPHMRGHKMHSILASRKLIRMLFDEKAGFPANVFAEN